MKRTWKQPAAIAQKFMANEYVAACYQVYCGGPKDNAYCTGLYADDGTDIANPPYEGARFRGCGGYHRVIGEGVPTNNGYVCMGEDKIPVFYWLGEVMDPTLADEGDMADFHFADLNRSDAVIFSDNPNHS